MVSNETPYPAPSATLTEVLLETALLVTTNRLLMKVDELNNINAATPGTDEPGGDMYFEL